LILGGVGLFIPQTQKIASLLLGIMIFLWFVLLHVPRAITLQGDEWIGVGESLAVAGICFMIAAVGKVQAQNQLDIEHNVPMERPTHPAA
jgi:hypothetical protein